MPWNPRTPSPRNRSLPGNWRTLRAHVLKRDQGRCYKCGNIGADQVDHVVSVGQWERKKRPGNPHNEANLASAHAACVRSKNAQEAIAARPSRKREPERHPGLLR
jgi:5-methylcytosine-specific restriction enzyme A